MNKKSAFKGVDLKRFGMLIALVIIIVLFTILTKGLILKPMNIGNLINQNSYVVILAVGMLLCILTGGNIDLSVGSVVALIGACAGTFIITLGWNVYLSIGLCLLIGIAVGAWQGFWIAYVGIPPFITTLSGMLVFRGITLLILNGLTLAPFPDAYQKLSTGFLPDLVESFTLFGGKSNLLCIIVGVLAGIAAISLVVGGIGIMNIMLVSVTERTREIGIRKSLGAKERYIMQQFVIEAAATSALGGIIGILLGDGLSLAATSVIARVMEESLTVSPTIGAVLLAFGISVGIGILFGYLPAKKAAQLNPIDALHYD